MFTPNVRGLLGSAGAGAAQQLLNGKSGAPGAAAAGQQQPGGTLKNALGGLLGKH